MADVVLDAGHNLRFREDASGGVRYLDALVPTPYAVGIGAPYATIQAAVDVAVAAGAGGDVPALVWVQPGAYAGAVTLRDGITVMAAGQARLAGRVTLAADASGVSGKARWRGIDIAGDGSVAAVSVSDTGELELRDCRCSNTGAAAVAEVTGASAALRLDRVELLAQGTGESLRITGGVVTASGTVLDGPVVAEGGELSMAQCTAMTLAASGAAEVLLTDVVFDNGADAAITLNGTGDIILTHIARLGTGALLSGASAASARVVAEGAFVSYDNAATGLAASTVQGAVDALHAVVLAQQCVTDHGQLTGLADDDHPQYLTPSRGDGRYVRSDDLAVAAYSGDYNDLYNTPPAAIPLSQKGAASGVATLDVDGKVPLAQIPAGLTGGEGGVSDHALLTGRDVADQHPVAAITGLQSALDAKAAASHTHALSDVTELQTSLAAKAALSHAHAVTDVTGLQTALDGKSDTSHTHPANTSVTVVTALPAADQSGATLYLRRADDADDGFYWWDGGAYVQIGGVA